MVSLMQLQSAAEITVQHCQFREENLLGGIFSLAQSLCPARVTVRAVSPLAPGAFENKALLSHFPCKGHPPRAKDDCLHLDDCSCSR